MRSDELLFFIACGYISAALYTSAALLLSKVNEHGKTISIVKNLYRGKAISIVKIIKIISLTALQKAEYMIK